MKASEAITRLQRLIADHGDREVRIYNMVESGFDSINEIEPRRFLPTDDASDEDRWVIFFGIDPYAIGDWRAKLRHDRSSDD